MRQKEFDELNETELIILKDDYEKWKKDHKEELYQGKDLWPFKEESYYKRFKERFNFLIEEKDKELKMVEGIKKVPFEDIKLSEEIKENGKIIKEGIKNINFPIFLVEIPYNGFKILLQHNIAPKSQEHFYYAVSKYGWWQYCAKKDELDEIDKKLLLVAQTPYGMYREDDHSFCNDNLRRKEDLLPFEEVTDDYKVDFYNLHPNEMVKIVKRNIDKFYEDKEKLKNEKTPVS